MGALHRKLAGLWFFFHYLQKAQGFSARKVASPLLKAWMPEIDEVWKEFINRAAQPAKHALDIVSARERLRLNSGSCLCGNVAYEFSTEVWGVIHCYCTTCCKAQVYAVASFARVPALELKYTPSATGEIMCICARVR